MAQVIYILSREQGRPIASETVSAQLAQHLRPKHFAGDVRTLTDGNGLSVAISAATPAVSIRDHGVAVGYVEPGPSWWRPGTQSPEGAYAIFRSNKDILELVTDFVASRSIWYVHTEDFFAAATSQRAVVAYLRSFDPRPEVIPWMLSTGSLGPGLSWDRRIQMVPSNAVVRLDRHSWVASVHAEDECFAAQDLSREEHQTRFQEALDVTFQGLKVDWDQWVVALSGGYDSRYSLIALQNRGGLRCVTWGSRQALDDVHSDAYIAQSLARSQGIDHQYFVTDVSEAGPGRVFDNFILGHEGRVDDVESAMDGYSRYKHMTEAGIIGLIRSDEGFGWIEATDERDARWSVGLILLAEYGNLSGLDLEQLGPQEFPPHLQKNADESIATWRDRLYHQYRLPFVLAALSQARLDYMEQANPLLTRRILRIVRTQPDALRTNKALFRQLAANLVPDVPFAAKPSIPTSSEIFSRRDVLEILRDELTSDRARGIFPRKLLDNVVRTVSGRGEKNVDALGCMKSNIKNFLPPSIRRVVGSWLRDRTTLLRPMVDPARLAMRCYIVCRMYETLRVDAAHFSSEFDRPA